MKKTIISLAKTVLKASIIALLLTVVYSLIAGILLSGVFKDGINLDPIVYLISMVTFFIFYYKVRENNRYELFSGDNKFNTITEVKNYIKLEGKYLLIFYSVMAILCELNCLITPATPRKPVVFVCSMFFPFFTALKLPIIRSVISILITCAVHIIIAVFRSYKISKKSVQDKF